MPIATARGGWFLLAAASAAAWSCATGAPAFEEVQSSKARLAADAVPAADVSAAAAANNAFGLALFEQLDASGTPANLVFSPYSAAVALAMTDLGAKGETEAQLSRALAFTLAADRAHAALGALDLALTSRGQNAQGEKGTPFRLRIANSTWGQKGYPFVGAYLDGLAVDYGAGLDVVDFEKDPEAARPVINQWVSDQTERKIQELIPAGLLDAATRLVLVNAIYFKGAWKTQFDPASTQPGPFHVSAGQDVAVPLMSQTELMPYASSSSWQAAELRYDGDEVGLLVVLPAEGMLGEVEASLTGDALAEIVAALAEANTHLTMPRWKLTWSSSLEPGLQRLGVTDAFAPGVADLSGIGGSPGDLYVSQVLQKAFIAVDEEGTEAAAATAAVVSTTSAPVSPPTVVELRLDRPFLYFIRDVATGAVLFMGRVADPSVEQ